MYNYRNPYFNHQTYTRINPNINSHLNKNSPIHDEPKSSSAETRDKKIKFQENSNDVLFEFFGLKIYMDDLLIICVLLFLYQEGIQDEYLFISLILLLLS